MDGRKDDQLDNFINIPISIEMDSEENIDDQSSPEMKILTTNYQLSNNPLIANKGNA